jgi:flagellar M-ring protein FliF
MDFLNKSLAQLSELFRSMTPAARVTAGLLLAVLVISVVFLFRGQVSGPDEYLMDGEPIATPSLRGPMEKAFDEAGLHDYEIDGARIRVPRGKRSAYMAALAKGEALPANFGDYMRRAFNSGNVMTSSAQKAEWTKLGLQEELSRLVSNMRGVEKAAVLYNTQKESPFSRTSVTQATVFVRGVGGEPLDDSLVRAIRNAVAPCIGARPENVTVTDDGSGMAYQGGSGGQLPSGISDAYADRMSTYERHWRTKIERALAYVRGATIAVNVKLNSDIENIERSTEFDPKPVPIEVNASSRQSTSQGPAPQGRPGLAGQGAIPNAGAQIGASLGPRSEEKDKDRQERNVVSQRHQTRSVAPLTPEQVAVSVSIPSSYLQQVWREQNPTEVGAEAKKPDAAALARVEQAEKDKIVTLIAGLLPAAGATDRKSLVNVAVFQDLPGPKIAEPSLADTALSWLSAYWSTIGMAGFAVVALMMLRSMIRSAPIDTTPPIVLQGLTFPAGSDAPSPSGSTGREETPATPTPTRVRKRGVTGPSLRDELVDIVREDPDAAAAILRNWIGNAT